MYIKQNNMVVNKRLPKEFREKESPEERAIRYKEKKKQNEKRARELRKQEKLQNAENKRRLYFLAKTVKALGYNYKQIALKMGLTQQTMTWIFSVKDDCKLSMAENILDAIGFNLGVEIKNSNKKYISKEETTGGTESGVKYTIEGDIVSIQKELGQPMPEYIREINPEARMCFLADYFKSLGFRITDLSNKIEINLTGIRYIFVHDDIKISQIYQIAGKTGGEVIWKINKK